MIALSGGTGFVGARLVHRLLASGESVVLLTRQHHSSLTPIAKFGTAEIRTWDATSGERPPLQGVRAVIHLAAYIPANYSDVAEAETCLRANALGTLALLQACEEQHVEHAILCSSGNVYKRSIQSVDESAPTYPDGHGSFYLGSKLLGEIWACHFAGRGVNSMILRPSSIYGPGMKGGVVRLLVDRLSTGQTVNLKNQGRFSSDLVYVDDVVEACLSGLQKRATGIFNIGSGTTTTIANLASYVAEYLNISPDDFIHLEPPNDSDVGFSALAINKMVEILGVTPTSVADGIGRMIKEETK